MALRIGQKFFDQRVGAVSIFGGTARLQPPSKKKIPARKIAWAFRTLLWCIRLVRAYYTLVDTNFTSQVPD